jgi:hypothetical protein
MNIFGIDARVMMSCFFFSNTAMNFSSVTEDEMTDRLLSMIHLVMKVTLPSLHVWFTTGRLLVTGLKTWITISELNSSSVW